MIIIICILSLFASLLDKRWSAIAVAVSLIAQYSTIHSTVQYYLHCI